MKHVLIASAAIIGIGAVAHFALAQDADTGIDTGDSDVTVTRVEQNPMSPFMEISLVTKTDVVSTFAAISRIMDKQPGDRTKISAYIFHLGLPVTDNFGNNGIGFGMDVRVPGPLQPEGNVGATPGATTEDMLKVAFPRPFSRVGAEWGRQYCGQPISCAPRDPNADIPAEQKTAFCAALSCSR